MSALAGRLVPSWVRRPRPTARLRLTLFYGGLFLVSGAALLAITYLLVSQTTAGTITYDSAHHTYTYVGPDGVMNLAGGGQMIELKPRPRQHVRLTHGQSLAVVEQLRALAVSQHANELHQLLFYSAIALGVMAVLSVVLGWLVAGRVLRPLRTMTDTARRISASNLHQRLALDGPDDEFKELGATLNALLGRLDASFQSQRRFVANASHELRTPLTVERTLLQVALADPDLSVEDLRQVYEKLLVSGADQERLIEALLTLASSERGLEDEEPFDLATVVQTSLAESSLDEARRRGIRLTTSIEPAPTVGDARLAQRLVANLLDNAISHNYADGQIDVRTGTRAGRPFVSVANSGPVVPETEISRLLEPFQQLGDQRTSRRNGHGIGLAIVAAIAAAHYADLSVRSRHNGGLEVEVLFVSLAGRAANVQNGSSAISVTARGMRNDDSGRLVSA
jgi:signal transduction histidine kinase